MNSGTKTFGIVVAAVGIIIGLSIFLGRQDQPRAVDPGTPPEISVTPDAPKTSNSPAGSKPQASMTSVVTTNPQTESVPSTNPAAAAGLITDWNEKIDAALQSGGEDRDIAKSMLKLFPKFP